MAVANSTVCTEEPYFHTNCDTTTTLSVVSKSSVIAGLSKNHNLTYLNEYFKNKTDGTKKIKRAKRSENQLSNYEVDDALKSSDFSDEIKKPQYIAKKDNADYNNIIYDWNYENKHNADIGKYYIDEPGYIVKEKYLNKFKQNDTLFYLTKSTHKNKTDPITNNAQRIANKEVRKDIDLIANAIDEQQEANFNNLNKNEYMNQPKQKRVSKPKIKRNFYEDAKKNKKYDRLKLSNETKLMDEAQYYIDNDYFFTKTNKPQNKYNVEKSDQPPDTNRATDTNKPQRTITPDYVNVKKSSIKQKYTRGEEEKHLLSEYGPVDTVMIEDARNLSFDEDLFTVKLITSSTMKQQEIHTQPWQDIRKEETYFFRQFKTDMTPCTTPYEGLSDRKVRFGLKKAAIADFYEPGHPAVALHGLYRFNIFKFREESNDFAFGRAGYKQGMFLYCLPCIFLLTIYLLAWFYSCYLCPRKVRTYKRCEMWKVRYYRKIMRICLCLSVFWGFLGVLTVFVEHDQIHNVGQRYLIPFTKLMDDFSVQVITYSNWVVLCT